MKTFLVIAMLIIMASTQTTITPKTQACVCSNLLNLVDCNALSGCQWTPANSTNSTNTTTTTLTGTCANASTNTTSVLIPTFCGSITNGTLCAGQVGCAYLNNTCQIFTGCTAYVKTTHSDCQLISTQCTTDGTRCALPAACNTYTTQAVCVGSQGSTTKNCKWTPPAGSATTGTCSDTICTDAPTTLATLAQCQAYLSTCSSTGKGCIATLASCTTYLATDGCSARIGLEGKCIDTTPASANCRAQVCTDATSASATSCSSFLTSSTCLFNGKGCVASPLPACNTYLASQTCDGMIGSDGKCTTDKTSTTNCKLYTCADAPTSTVTDSDCSKINTSCVTNGQGCVTSPLPQCSTYTGSASTPCTSFKGLNGICKASATATCTDRTCTDDAAKTFTTDAQCDNYFKGCVTKGVGCVQSRLPCSQYSGTTAECTSFIGSDSNCTAPAGQTTGACSSKSCSDTAIATATTNQACSAYSFQCATTGNGCTQPDVCVNLTKDVTCQGKSDCSYNKICIDRSDCGNYKTQTLCSFNKQQYLSGTNFYERPCTWSGSTCSNTVCTTQLTTLTTDDQCNTALAGCLTKNGGGCIDISADCNQYKGVTATCETFLGLNKTNKCTQISTGAATDACVIKTCDIAKQVKGAQTSSSCGTYLQGCNFDGVDNCTNSDCTKYYGILTTCQNITTALSSNKAQKCWQSTASPTATTACTVRTCADAPSTNTSDSLCATFLDGCVTNGAGCVIANTSCANYIGGTIDICSKFYESGKQCTGVGTGTTSQCIPKACTDSISSPSTSNCNTYLSTCTFDGTNCLAKAACSSYAKTTAALCNALVDNNNKGCKYVAGASSCSDRSCSDAITAANDADCKAYLSTCYYVSSNSCAAVTSCSSYTKATAAECNALKDSNGKNCGFKAGASSCSDRSCQDVITAANASDCSTYLSSCKYVSSNTCADKACTDTITAANNADCIAYLSTCYYVSSNTCATAITCSSYTKTSASECTALTDSYGKECGYKTGASTCSDRTCFDEISSPSGSGCSVYLQTCISTAYNTCLVKTCNDTIIASSDSDCKSYLSTCYYVSSNTCATALACSSYTKTSAAACNVLKDTNGKPCGFKTGASNCSDRTCTDVISASGGSDCEAYLSTCYFVSSNTCAPKTACSSYTKTSAADCNALKDTNGKDCGYKTGASNCSDKTCQDVIRAAAGGGSDCGVYLSSCKFVSENTCIDKTCNDTITAANDSDCKSYLSTCYYISTNKCATTSACSSYTKTSAADCNALKDTNGKVCGFKTGASSCSDKSCTDVLTAANDAACKTYLSTCYFVSTDTCSTIGACSSYTKTSAADCNALKDTNGKVCGYKTGASSCSDKSCQDVVRVPVPGGTECQDYLSTCKYVSPNVCGDKTCNDTVSSPSTANCSAYLSSCLFDGTKCYAPAACNTYAATGSAYSDKATYCNSLNGLTSATKCTYKSGDTNCSDATTCGSYQVSGFSNTTTSFAGCSLMRDNTGALCGFTAGSSTCSTRTCAQQLTAASCSDTWLTGCLVNPNWNCKSKVCTNAPTTLATDADCKAFRNGCVTNGAGCLDITIANCAVYTGTQAACQKFTGKDGPCTNSSSALASSNCQLRQCTDNGNETTQAACDTWIAPKSGVKSCIWTGTTGCIALTTCDQITGTIDSCAVVLASDGPCSLSTSSTKCVSNSTICTKAPSSFVTDAQCQKWHSTCLSTGFGCVSDSADFCKNIVSGTLCTSYKSTQSCDLAIQCAQKPTTCSGFTTPYECNNIILTGTAVTCGWNFVTGVCATLTCDLLPITTTTDAACSTLISTCTTNGAGCVTKVNCSGYNKIACGVAATTDGSKCIWSSSVCRNIVCSDNTTAKSDSECDTYLKGCRTTGTGCSNSFNCTTFTSAALCLKDASNNPCYWYKGACQQYTQCTDILQTTHAACQQLSPLCTTDGTKCIAITGCAKTNSQVSCVVGTDGPCGYLPASGTTAATCAPYTNCAAATGGTSFAACQAWGTTCVSNGTSCISQTTCTGYLTEAACGNLGISGTSTQKCIYSSGACRPQVCTDATATTVTAIATHTGCVAFAATTPCTTNGTNGCIAQSTCSSYSQTLSAACVQGTDGPCFFQTTTTAATATAPASTTTACRLKQCQDILGTTSASCSTAIIGIGSKCVSNGVNCIAQSTCSTYTAREACLGGGSDGACAFTPGANTTTPSVGTCQLFTACNQANQDQTACSLKSASCYFTPAPTNGTSSCTAHNCTTKASGSTCQAVPNFDLSQYQICVLAVGTTTCQPGTPAAFPQSSCYTWTLSTYTWNPTSGQCQSCQAVTTPNNTNNTVNNTNNTYGYLVSILISIAFMI